MIISIIYYEHETHKSKYYNTNFHHPILYYIKLNININYIILLYYMTCYICYI